MHKNCILHRYTFLVSFSFHTAFHHELFVVVFLPSFRLIVTIITFFDDKLSFFFAAKMGFFFSFLFFLVLVALVYTGSFSFELSIKRRWFSVVSSAGVLTSGAPEIDFPSLCWTYSSNSFSSALVRI